MILIADSGSTKTDWRIISAQGDIIQAKTEGFNPYYQSPDDLKGEIQKGLIPKIDSQIEEVHFYGAGCSSDKNRNVVKAVFSEVFSKAEIYVSHDLLAAARALCGHEKGIACIVGTGINSCKYDGKNIVENAPSLGYILGDEGSGAYLGKRLLVDFIRDDTPQEIADKLRKRFDLSKEAILENIYQKDRPGKYLASFSKFVFQNLKNPYCYRLVYDSIKLFFELNVLKYADYSNYKVHFTGSVAFYYSNIVRQVANDLGVTVGNIIESPIAGLTLYHQKQLSKLS